MGVTHLAIGHIFDQLLYPNSSPHTKKPTHFASRLSVALLRREDLGSQGPRPAQGGDAAHRQDAARDVADRPRLHQAQPGGELRKQPSQRGATANHAQRSRLGRPKALRTVRHDCQPWWQSGRRGLASQHPDSRRDACATPKRMRPTPIRQEDIRIRIRAGGKGKFATEAV